MTNTNLDLFKGIVRYTDKAGVQHAMETATNLSTLNEVRSALNTIKTNLERQGFIVNAADVVDVLNDVVGGTGTETVALGDIWKDYSSPLSSAKAIKAICHYKDADGTMKCLSSPVCSSRPAALAELSKMIADLNGAGLSVLSTCITDDSEFPETDLTNLFGSIR